MKWEKDLLVNKTSFLKRGVSPKYVEGDGLVIINQSVFAIIELILL